MTSDPDDLTLGPFGLVDGVLIPPAPIDLLEAGEPPDPTAWQRGVLTVREWLRSQAACVIADAYNAGMFTGETRLAELVAVVMRPVTARRSLGLRRWWWDRFGVTDVDSLRSVAAASDGERVSPGSWLGVCVARAQLALSAYRNAARIVSFTGDTVTSVRVSWRCELHRALLEAARLLSSMRGDVSLGLGDGRGVELLAGLLRDIAYEQSLLPDVSDPGLRLRVLVCDSGVESDPLSGEWHRVRSEGAISEQQAAVHGTHGDWCPRCESLSGVVRLVDAELAESVTRTGASQKPPASADEPFGSWVDADVAWLAELDDFMLDDDGQKVRSVPNQPS